MSLRRKALGWLLSLTLALGMVPAAAMTAFAAEGDPVVIDEITITDVPLPVAGKKASEVPIESMFGPAGAFEVTSSEWLSEVSSILGDKTFSAGSYYIAMYWLQPKEGYKFAADLSVDDVVTDRGTVEYVRVSSSDGECAIKVKMPSHDGTRSEVSSVAATSDIESVLAYGADVAQPTLTSAAGSHVTFNTKSSYLYWEKSTGDSWATFTGDTFTAGTYRLQARVEIDAESTATHVLGYPLGLSVDGVEWEVGVTYGLGLAHPKPSYAYVTSPEFTVEAPSYAPLVFEDSNNYDISAGFTNVPMTAFSVKAGVSGGMEPYVFSKVSGPEWVSVSADGTLSGTPTVAGANDLLVVRVTDSADPASSAEITIYVGDTRLSAADRVKVDSIAATSDIASVLEYGAPLAKPTFAVTSGEPAYFDISPSRWLKYDEGTGYWNDYSDATFAAGTYRFTCQVRIDGYTHALDEDLTVTVDGVEWVVGSITNDDYDGSEAWLYSPEFRIYDPAFEAFTDVPEGAWFRNAVAWAVENGVTSGLSATEFGPNATCTRAQAVTFLWNAAGKPAPSSTDMPFTDVKATAWYRDAVLWAVEEGITSGTSATTFSPNAKCTRAQIVTFMWNAEGKPAPSDADVPFTDVKASAWYRTAVAWAVEQGVTSGISATKFGPNNNCTRAQIVTFMYNYMG